MSDAAGSGLGSVRMGLARYRSTVDTVAAEAHLVPLPVRVADHQAEVIGALCGRRLHTAYLETVTPGHGRWCSACFVASVLGARPDHVPPLCPDISGGDPARADSYAGRQAAGVAYRRLGWPVTLRRRAVALDLDLEIDAVALAIPTALATQTAEILLQRRSRAVHGAAVADQRRRAGPGGAM